MRPGFVPRTLLAALLLASACSAERSTGARTAATLTITSAADLTGTVTQSRFESGNGPGFGPYAQYDLWLEVGGATSPNAGVVITKLGPVFIRRGDRIEAAAASDIRAGDHVEVWHDVGAAYGAVQGPPDSPTYTARQIVIDR